MGDIIQKTEGKPLQGFPHSSVANSLFSASHERQEAQCDRNETAKNNDRYFDPLVVGIRGAQRCQERSTKGEHDLKVRVDAIAIRFLIIPSLMIRHPAFEERLMNSIKLAVHVGMEILF